MRIEETQWLAGLCDAEGCFHSGMHRTRPNNVVCWVQIGLIRHGVMRHARDLISRVVGEAVPEIHVRHATKTQREFYSLVISSKRQVAALVEALWPHLRGKQAEVLAQRDIMRRASATSRYAATDVDRQLCRLSTLVKRGDLSGKERIIQIVGEPLVDSSPSSAWLAGILDGDGSIGMLRTVRGDAVYYAPRVNISSSDEPALRTLRDSVSRMYATQEAGRQAARGGARENYGFNIATEDAERFLRDLRPHLRVKAAEAEAMLRAFSGEITRERAHDLLRAMKRDDDPESLLAASVGGVIPSLPTRVSHAGQYRRHTYAEMGQRGLWSSEQARERLGGVGHKVWTVLVEGLPPYASIGNKRYYSPPILKLHVTDRLPSVVRTDARERIRDAMDSWDSL